MIGPLWLFWYCYDDALAAWVGSDVVGDMPLGLWFTVFGVLAGRAVVKTVLSGDDK